MTAIRPTPTDAQLLSRFIDDRDDRTFATIVRKHGPMVFATCRRIVGHHHDAEDAFQACFLVLAAKAETVRPQSRLGAWLHGVAVRCALKARRVSRFTEVPLLEWPMPERDSIEPDLVSHLDDALAAIPDKYRAAVVLCHLQGRTRSEAARELGWSEGTLSGRLHRAMELLAKRLTARGVTAGVSIVLSAGMASAIVPAKLFASTNSAAALMIVGCSDGSVATTLAHGVLRTMTIRKLKLATGLLFLGTGFGAVALGTLAEAEAKPGPHRIYVKAPVPTEAKRTWKELFAVTHGAAVTAVAMNDEMIATAGDDCTLKLFNPKDGKQLELPIRGARFTIPADGLRFVAKGKYLMMTMDAGAMSNGAAIRYEQRGGGFVGDTFGVTALGFSDDLSVVVIRDLKQLGTKLSVHDNLWDVPKALLNPTGTIDFPKGQAIVKAAVSHDGKRLVVANADSVIRTFQDHDDMTHAFQSESKIEMPAKTGFVALKLSDDGKQLAVIGEKGFAKLFDAATGKEWLDLKGHDVTVNAVAFTPDGKEVATASGASCRVFDAKTGKLLYELKGHTDDVTALAFAADGKRLATGSKDKTVKVWERK